MSNHVYRSRPSFPSMRRHGGRPIASSAAIGPHEGGESVHEFAQASFHRFIGKGSRRIECTLGAQHEKPAAEPRLRTQGPQHRQSCVLAEDGAESARRRAHDGDRLAAENAPDVGRWPR